MLAFVAALAMAPAALLSAGPYHTRHAELLATRDLPTPNREVLAAVDRIQARFPTGGGYFTGVKADPPECPVGYALTLKGSPLLAPARTTSYCSGSSYAALVEALDRLLPGAPSPERLEALRLQEPDGGRREDETKAWGWWNADGFGCDFALVQYLGAGERVRARDARPGDFMNLSWKSGLGHSVVFLGWTRDAQSRPSLVFWSSQKSTNGLADSVAPLDSVRELSTVRLVHPERLLTFTPAPVDRKAAPAEPPPTLDE